jgi:hypothetical protein
MKYLRSGLGAILLFAIVIRISAEVVAPAIPVVAIALVVVSVAVWLFGSSGRSRY